MIIESLYALLLLSGIALLGSLALAAWRLSQRSLPTAENTMAQAQQTMGQLQRTVDRDVAPALQRIDAVAAEVEGVVRPIRQGVEQLRSTFSGNGAPVALAAKGAVAAAQYFATRQSAASPTPPLPKAVAAASVPWQANAAVGLGVAQVALQATTMWYVKRRFDQLADQLTAMEATLRVAAEIGNRLAIVQITKPLRDARARLNLVAAVAASQAGESVHVARDDLLFVVHELASGAAQLQGLASLLEPHHMLADPKLVEAVAAQLHDAVAIARALRGAANPEIAAKAAHAHAAAEAAMQSWRDRLATPVAQRGKIAASACALKGRDIGATRARLAALLASPTAA